MPASDVIHRAKTMTNALGGKPLRLPEWCPVPGLVARALNSRQVAVAGECGLSRSRPEGWAMFSARQSRLVGVAPGGAGDTTTTKGPTSFDLSKFVPAHVRRSWKGASGYVRAIRENRSAVAAD